MHDFLPITLNSLKDDARIGCDIYLHINNNGSSRYILYCKSDAAFDDEQKEMLVRKNINKLFIGKDDKKNIMNTLNQISKISYLMKEFNLKKKLKYFTGQQQTCFRMYLKNQGLRILRDPRRLLTT